AVKRELIAALILADISPSATAPRLKRLERHSKPSWSKPLDIKFWIGECLKHKLARRVEFARDEHFLFPWFRGNCRFVVCHLFLISFLFTLLSASRASLFHLQAHCPTPQNALPISASCAEPMLQIETASLD